MRIRVAVYVLNLCALLVVLAGAIVLGGLYSRKERSPDIENQVANVSKTKNFEILIIEYRNVLKENAELNNSLVNSVAAERNVCIFMFFGILSNLILITVEFKKRKIKVVSKEIR